MAGHTCGYVVEVNVRIRMAAAVSLTLALTMVAGCGDDDTATPDEVSAELSVKVTHPDHPTIEYQLTCDGRRLHQR